MQSPPATIRTDFYPHSFNDFNSWRTVIQMLKHPMVSMLQWYLHVQKTKLTKTFFLQFKATVLQKKGDPIFHDSFSTRPKIHWLKHFCVEVQPALKIYISPESGSTVVLLAPLWVTLLEKFWRISLYTVCDWLRYCTAQCDVKFSQLEGNYRHFRHIELSNSVIS